LKLANHRKPKISSFIGLNEELLRHSILAEVSGLNSSYSKQWIRVQWRTERDKILFRGSNLKKMFSGADFDVSVSKNKRLQEVFTGKIAVARLFFV